MGAGERPDGLTGGTHLPDDPGRLAGGADEAVQLGEWRVKQFEKQQEEERRFAADRARAYRAMSSDMDGTTVASWDLRRKLLDEEREEYGKFIDDKRLLDVWYNEQRQRMAIEESQATGGFFAGMRAGVAELKRDLPTIGQLGADIAQQGIGGISRGLREAVFESRNLKESLRELGMSVLGNLFEAGMNRAMTSGLNALFPAKVAHRGGIVGVTSFPTRAVSPALFARAPRLHDGLRPDEFPAILEQGEKVTSRGGASAEGRVWGEILAVLRDIRAAGPARVAVVRSREEIYDALRHPDGQRALAEVNARIG